MVWGVVGTRGDREGAQAGQRGDTGLQDKAGQSGAGGTVGSLRLASAFACTPAPCQNLPESQYAPGRYWHEGCRPCTLRCPLHVPAPLSPMFWGRRSGPGLGAIGGSGVAGAVGWVQQLPARGYSRSPPAAANQLLPAPALRPAPRARCVGVLMRREPDSPRLALNCCCLLALNEALLQKRQQPRLLSPRQPPPSSRVPA